MTIYRARDFARYACEQVASGALALIQHHVDTLGLCRSCGRLYPCSDAQKARWQVEHYLPYVESPQLVRPYVPTLTDSGTTVEQAGDQAAHERPGRLPAPAPVSGGLALAGGLVPNLEQSGTHHPRSAPNPALQARTRREE